MSPVALWLFALAMALLAIHIARDWRHHPPEGMVFDRPLLRLMSEGLGWISALIITAFALALSGIILPFLANFGFWLLCAHARQRGLLRRLHGTAPLLAISALACALYLFQETVGETPVPALENLIPK